jgi:HSP20 family molecular chaperone IbpA
MYGERDKKYHADIPVSVDLKESSTKAAYSNGILELKIWGSAWSALRNS